MSARLVLALLLTPAITLAADAPKAVPITVRPVATKAAAAPVPVATKPVAPAKAVPPPFPAPVLGPVTQDMRFTAGVVATVNSEKHTFELTTPAGTLNCTIGDASRVVGTEGKPVLFTDVAPGASMRVYYRVGKGAEVVEADLLAAH